MERKSDRFAELIKGGKYFFHFHTNFTDGKSSFEEYCNFAEKEGFRVLIVLEHVRKTLSYDFNQLISAIEEQRRERNLELLVGVEAKVLPDGCLDVGEDVLRLVDVVGIAEHGFLGDASALSKALIKAFNTYKSERYVIVWVHPGTKLLKLENSSMKLYTETIQIAKNLGIFIEHNLRYQLPPDDVLSKIAKNSKVIGFDAHSIADAEDLLKRARESAIFTNDDVSF